MGWTSSELVKKGLVLLKTLELSESWLWSVPTKEAKGSTLTLNQNLLASCPVLVTISRQSLVLKCKYLPEM